MACGSNSVILQPHPMNLLQTFISLNVESKGTIFDSDFYKLYIQIIVFNFQFTNKNAYMYS